MELRELTATDADAVRRIYSGASVQYLGRGEMDAEEAERYVAQAGAWADERPRKQYILGIEVPGDLVGVVKLNVADNEGRLSYILRENRWGLGLGTGAAAELLAMAFGTFGLAAVHAKHRLDNPASGRVLAKAGFTHISTAHGLAHYTVKHPLR